MVLVCVMGEKGPWQNGSGKLWTSVTSQHLSNMTIQAGGRRCSVSQAYLTMKLPLLFFLFVNHLQSSMEYTLLNAAEGWGGS